MPQELTSTQTPTAVLGSPAAPIAGATIVPNVQTPNPTAQQTTPPETNAKGFTEEQVAEMIEKARADEKKKVFSKLDALKESNAKIQEQITELESGKKTVEADRDALREGRASELKSVNDELGQLRQQNEKLSKAIEASVDIAAKRIREQELKAYRVEKISEAKLRLPELVSGVDEAEIDAAIEVAKTKEQSIAEALREEIRNELAENLPRPIATDGSQGRGPTPVVTPQNRQAVVKLSKDEYQRRRQELLQEAKTKVGL